MSNLNLYFLNTRMLVLNRDVIQVIMYHSTIQDAKNISHVCRLTYYALDANCAYNWFCRYFKKQLPEITKRYSLRIFKSVFGKNLKQLKAKLVSASKYTDLLKVLVYNYDINKLFQILCCYGELDEVTFIMKHYPECDPKTLDNTAILCASENGHLNVVKYLVSIGCDPKARGNIAIQLSSANGHLEVVKYLVSIGCDPKAQNNKAIQYASYKGHLEIVKYLVSIGCDPVNNNIVIIWASSKGHLEIVKYLVSIGCDSKMCDNTAIQCASELGHLEIVKYLVSIGCDPKAYDNYAIRHASLNGHLKVVEYLESLGC